MADTPSSSPNTRKILISKYKELFERENFEDLTITHENNTIIKFLDLYKVIDVIGSGSFGLVVKAIEKSTNEIYAIKIIQKNSTDTEKERMEAILMKNLSHKNIVSFVRSHESETLMIFVMEYLKGGSLTQLIRRKYLNNKPFSEPEIRIIMTQILEALSYLHLNNYMHRDLKPDNILFSRKNDLYSLKLVDFGLGKKMSTSLREVSNEKVGTIIFMSPEQINSQSYTKLSDIWACGIILYILFSFKHPFYQEGEILTNFNEKLLIPPTFPSEFPELAKNFFSKLCSIDINWRYSALESLDHPFITTSFNGIIPRTLSEDLYIDEIKESSLSAISCILFISKMILDSEKVSTKVDLKNITSLKTKKFFERLNRTDKSRKEIIKELSLKQLQLKAKEIIKKPIKNKRTEIKNISITASNSATTIKIFSTPTYLNKKKFQLPSNNSPSRSSSKNSNNSNSNSSYVSKVSNNLKMWYISNNCQNENLKYIPCEDQKRQKLKLPQIPIKIKKEIKYSTFYEIEKRNKKRTFNNEKKVSSIYKFKKEAQSTFTRSKSKV